MIQYIFCFNRQGKLRMQKWYDVVDLHTKLKIISELTSTILSRQKRMCSFLEYRGWKIVYASLYMCCAVDPDDNELIMLEVIHRFVEMLDAYFGSVCELDIIFNYEKVYFILDEYLIAGEVQEVSKDRVLRAVSAQDQLQEEETEATFLHDYGLG